MVHISKKITALTIAVLMSSQACFANFLSDALRFAKDTDYIKSGKWQTHAAVVAGVTLPGLLHLQFTGKQHFENVEKNSPLAKLNSSTQQTDAAKKTETADKKPCEQSQGFLTSLGAYAKSFNNAPGQTVKYLWTERWVGQTFSAAEPKTAPKKDGPGRAVVKCPQGGPEYTDEYEAYGVLGTTVSWLDYRFGKVKKHGETLLELGGLYGLFKTVYSLATTQTTAPAPQVNLTPEAVAAVVAALRAPAPVGGN